MYMSVHICNRENGITQAGKERQAGLETMHVVHVVYISRWTYGTP